MLAQNGGSLRVCKNDVFLRIKEWYLLSEKFRLGVGLRTSERWPEDLSVNQFINQHLLGFSRRCFNKNVLRIFCARPCARQRARMGQVTSFCSSQAQKTIRPHYLGRQREDSTARDHRHGLDLCPYLPRSQSPCHWAGIAPQVWTQSRLTLRTPLQSISL